MKLAYRLFSIAFVSFAGLAGSAGCATETDMPGIETTSENKVVRYSAEDLAALMPGESLYLDLALPNAVYVITYKNEASLGHVIVANRGEQYVLRDRVSGAADFQSNALKQVVLSGDLVMDPLKGKSVAPLPNGDEHIGTAQEAIQAPVCHCPCCQSSGGDLYCC